MDAASALAGTILLLSPAGVLAAPRRLDCSLTERETKAGPKMEFVVENRSITIVFDKDAKTVTVYQDDSPHMLKNVTMTEGSINGYVDQMSLGIDPSSWRIVFQTYKRESMSVEFGACTLSTKPPP